MLLEGGNVLIRVGSEVHSADKIDLRKISREEITAKIMKMLNDLNDEFEKKFKQPIWRNKEYLNSHIVFNGSSNAFFNKNIDDEEFKKYKPIVGDLDISVPDILKNDFFDFLKEKIGKEVSKNIIYLGGNKEEAGNNHQLNSLFLLKDYNIKIQIDFEFVEYDTNTWTQTDFSSFAHSSEWSDTVQGFEIGLKAGVSHKYLLINLVRAISKNPNIAVLTDKSPEPKDKSEDHLMKFSNSSKVQKEVSMLAFSIDRGLRMKFRQIFYQDGTPVITSDGKFVFKEEKPSNSDYTKNLEEIFELIFKEKPDSSDLQKFRSFYGILDLLKKYNIEIKVIDKMIQSMVENSLWCKSCQPLAKTREEDEKIKLSMLKGIIQKFPSLKDWIKKTEKIREEYYNTKKLDRNA